MCKHLTRCRVIDINQIRDIAVYAMLVVNRVNKMPVLYSYTTVIGSINTNSMSVRGVSFLINDNQTQIFACAICFVLQ